ncbi:hypothetical protein D9758_008212 [Tetrapyrgos nigripes]|uniref:DUF6606 domain-containing protein n=1 Tax=Tetrapyrgos nigripes TaxID=182062 RepID=A0A8H5G1H9_9AGAR|nr:hypothetical protein D9758_008212 [Tetrapyrgos nigripes]
MSTPIASQHSAISHDRRSTRSLTPKSSNEPTRSTSATKGRKRSASPRVAFTSPKLSPEPSGVQNITRKVIRRLEGFGHMDVLEVDENDTDSNEEKERAETDEMGEVVESLLNGHANAGQVTKSPSSSNAIQPSKNAPEKKKIDWEIPRKVLHSSIGFFTIYLYLSQGSPRNVVIVLWSSLCIIVPADILRLRSPRFERFYESVLGFLMRESEKHTTNGVIWYILGVNFALTFLPLDIATVAILILSWADTAASTIGRAWGSLTPRLPSRLPILRLPLAPRKSLAGFLAATATGAAVAAGFWGWMAPMREEASDVSWRWSGLTIGGVESGFGGWAGLSMIALFSGMVSGVAEALAQNALEERKPMQLSTDSDEATRHRHNSMRNSSIRPRERVCDPVAFLSFTTCANTRDIVTDNIRTFTSNFTSSQEHKQWKSLKSTLRSFVWTQRADIANKADFMSAFDFMEPGDTVALFIRAQNPGIVFHVIERLKDPANPTSGPKEIKVIFEAFELSPPASAVKEPFEDNRFIEELANFLAEMNNESLVEGDRRDRDRGRKTTLDIGDNEETIDPTYITSLLTGIFRGCSGRSANVKRITKRIGDDSVGKGGKNNKPWRRSSAWLLLRVTLQKTLMRNGLEDYYRRWRTHASRRSHPEALDV